MIGSDESPAPPRALHTRAALVEAIALTAASCTVVALVVTVFSLCRASLGMTDDGFYLTWISDPGSFDSAITLFGFAYHPLWDLVGGDIVALRRAGLLLVVGIGALTAQRLLALFDAPTATRWPRVERVVQAALAGATTLQLLYLWLPTPNYNQLGVIGLLVGVIGMVELERSRSSHHATIAALLVGTGTWLTFLAKPTSAVLFALIATVAVTRLPTAPGRWWRHALIGAIATTMLLGATALAVDGSASEFIARLERGIGDSALRGSHTALGWIRIDGFPLGASTAAALVAWLVGAVFMALAVRRSHAATPPRAAASALLILVSIAAILVATGRLAVPGEGREWFQGLWPVGVVLGTALASGWRAHWRLAVLLGVLPLVHAAGSTNNYWDAVGIAGGFWTLAGIALVAGRSVDPRDGADGLRLTAMLVLLVFCTAILIRIGVSDPYAQDAPIDAMDVATDVGASGSRVFLTQREADRLSRLRRDAAAAGLDEDTEVLDLSGRAPGLVFAMGARPLAMPWTLGGYDGSAAAVDAVLGRVDCGRIAEAWILDELGGPRRINPIALIRHGISSRRSGSQIGYSTVTRLAGPTPFEWRLRRPTRGHAEAVRDCEAARSGDERFDWDGDGRGDTAP